MKMKGYSCDLPDECASSRLEDVDASFKDLTQVCGRIKNKKSAWAMDFLKKAAEGTIPVLYRTHNKRLGHRKELRGRKGRYPKKAAAIVLKVLKSAIANGTVKGLGDEFIVIHASANKKHVYPRLAPKGRQSRSFLETARIEVVLRPASSVPKGVEVRAPKKPDAKPEAKPEAKAKPAPKAEKPEMPAPKAEPAKKEPEKKSAPKPEEKPAAKKDAPKPEDKKAERKEPPSDALKNEGVREKQHKHAGENAAHNDHPKMEHDHGQAKKTEVKKE